MSKINNSNIVNSFESICNTAKLPEHVEPSKPWPRPEAKIDDGGPASDKTLRDDFAGQAVTGLIIKFPYYKADLDKPEEMETIKRRYKSIALSSYFIADAMIEARRGK